MDLEARCERLASLHVPGDPLVLPNAWDAASARAVVAAGFPVVATTSGGVAATLGYEDHQAAPAAEMLAAAGRIARAVDVPVTVDAEAGYGLEPRALVEALAEAGAAGCNLEDTDHATARQRDAAAHVAWLGEVRRAADAAGYPLVINARVDTFLFARGGDASQADLVEEGAARARAYLQAGAACAYPIFLFERDAIGAFVQAVDGPVNILAIPSAPAVPELAALGVARVSYGSGLHTLAMQHVEEMLRTLR